MANKEHLEVILKGSKSINQWRKQHPTETFDLSRADLSGINLSRANLSGASFYKSKLRKTRFFHADLSEADLSMADLTQADLSNSNLFKAFLVHAKLLNTNLSKATLSAANLLSANLSGANLSKANLTGASLLGVNLRGSKFFKAELFATCFYKASLSASTFTKAICEAVVFADCNLGDCIGLETVVHRGPSSIDVNTLIRTAGNIPENFLRGAGIPENIIAFLSSLKEEGTRFYTCFVSYGSPDSDFAKRLYNDLTGKEVRCWKYDESAVIGRGIWANIDQAIGVYDKVVVICSRDSLNRPGVLNEIERALQKEESLRQENARLIKETEKGKKPKLLDEDVLCPVRLDDYVITEWKHPRKADVTKKHIGDFCDWKANKKKYDLEFRKLLNALNPKSRGPVKET